MHALHEAKYNTRSGRPVEVTVGETVSINWTELFRQRSLWGYNNIYENKNMPNNQRAFLKKLSEWTGVV